MPLKAAVIESQAIIDPITGVTTHVKGNKSINYSTPNHSLTTGIFISLEVEGDLASLKAYTSFQDAQSATYVALNTGVADITRMREAYQITPSVWIRISAENERTNYYKFGDACFYEIFFERGMMFPMDETVRELLSQLEFAPCQIHLNSQVIYQEFSII